MLSLIRPTIADKTRGEATERRNQRTQRLAKMHREYSAGSREGWSIPPPYEEGFPGEVFSATTKRRRELLAGGAREGLLATALLPARRVERLPQPGRGTSQRQAGSTGQRDAAT